MAGNIALHLLSQLNARHENYLYDDDYVGDFDVDDDDEICHLQNAPAPSSGRL